MLNFTRGGQAKYVVSFRNGDDVQHVAEVTAQTWSKLTSWRCSNLGAPIGAGKHSY